MASIYRRGRVYYIKYRDGRRWVTKSLHTSNRQQALAERSKFERAVHPTRCHNKRRHRKPRQSPLTQVGQKLIRGNPSRLHHARYREMMNDQGITRTFFVEITRIIAEGRVPLECAEDALEMAIDDVRDQLAGDSVDWADGYGLRRTVKKKGLTTGR